MSPTTLSSAIVDNATPIVNAVLAGEKPDLDAVEEAYKKVDKDVKAVVAAGRAVVNFVKVVEKIQTGSTPQNAQSVELVKRGAELTHQVLIARNQVTLAEQRAQALQARSDRTQGIVQFITNAQSGIENDELTIRAAGVQAINAALLHVDTLLGFAFLAQRSLEIYTLARPPQPLALDAGSIFPDVVRAYQDGIVGAAADLVAEHQKAWTKLLQPISLQGAYVAYLQRDIDTDIVRLSFTAGTDPVLLSELRKTGALPFRLELTALSAGGEKPRFAARPLRLSVPVHPAASSPANFGMGAAMSRLGPTAHSSSSCWSKNPILLPHQSRR